MKKTQEGFHMTLDLAMEFYQTCIDLELETYEERMSLLREFVKQKRAGYIRDVAEAVKGKNVLGVSRRKKNV